MRALVLGGHGFLGRSVVAALRANGHAVEVGSRALRRTGSGSRVRRIRFEHRLSADAWLSAIEGVDVVVNCVGILRERGHETYGRVHHLAPETTVPIAVTDRDAERWDAVALVPAAEHPVGHRHPADEADEVDVPAGVAGDRPRPGRAQVMGPEPRAFETREEGLQGTNVARTHCSDA